MMAGGELQRGHTYFVLRGETISGETVDIQAIDLTNALYSRNWTMVNATVMNGSFQLLERESQTCWSPGANFTIVSNPLRLRAASELSDLTCIAGKVAATPTMTNS